MRYPFFGDKRAKCSRNLVLNGRFCSASVFPIGIRVYTPKTKVIFLKERGGRNFYLLKILDIFKYLSTKNYMKKKFRTVCYLPFAAAYALSSAFAAQTQTDLYTSSTQIACFGHAFTQLGSSPLPIQKSHLITLLRVLSSGFSTP